MHDSIEYASSAGVGTIRLSSATPGNALDAGMIRALHHALAQADSDPGCRIIVLASGGDAFCTGLALEAAFASGEPLDADLLALFVDCLLLICRSEKPVIACVEGEALGGGVGLVAACDLVIASDGAGFALPEVTVGLLPALVTPFLLRRLPAARIRYLCLATRRIEAREAHAWGLVDELAGGEIDRALRRQIQRLLRSSPRALAECKRYLDQLEDANLAARIQVALELADRWMRRPEVVAGIQDMLAGRSLPWSQAYRRSEDDGRS